MSFPRLETRARRAYRWSFGGTIGAAGGMSSWRQLTGKRASPLGLRGRPLTQERSCWLAPHVAGRGQPAPQLYRNLARLRLPRDESRVSGQGSRQTLALGDPRNPPSPTAYPQVLNRGSQQTPGGTSAQ